MTTMTRWFERNFPTGIPAGVFPQLVERLRGAPVRVEEKVRMLPGTVSTERIEGTWSIQEHVGHLTDLEPLWSGRIEDLMSGREELRPADLSNQKTHEAGHNDRRIEDLIADFRKAREGLIARLDGLGDEDVARTALHPRLKRPMAVPDLCYFVAEHDDHHLAIINGILRRLTR